MASPAIMFALRSLKRELLYFLRRAHEYLLTCPTSLHLPFAGNTVYKLVATARHTLTERPSVVAGRPVESLSAHYTVCLRAGSGQWYCIDDRTCQEVLPAEAKAPASYVLVYELSLDPSI